MTQTRMTRHEWRGWFDSAHDMRVLDLDHLDDEGVRDLMAGELQTDRGTGAHHRSAHMTPRGLRSWPGLLDEAIRSHDPRWLTRALSRTEFWLTEYERRGRTGRVSVSVPSEAAFELAHGEFLVYYIRAVCARALQLGQSRVRVVRARSVAYPQPESLALEGALVGADDLLDDVRRNRHGYRLGAPAGPGSGLAVAMVE